MFPAVPVELKLVAASTLYLPLNTLSANPVLAIATLNPFEQKLIHLLAIAVS